MPGDVDKFLNEPEPERMPLSEERELLLTIKEMIRDELRGVQQPAPAPAPNPEPNTNTNSNNVTGATFAAPLVVQYFNGDSPVKEPPVVEKQPEPAPAPAAEPAIPGPA